MRTRPLGASGLAVTRIGLGLAALGRPAYINLGRHADLGPDRDVGAMERRCHEVLDAARDAGIRYVDAARSYGLAEAFLAHWLERRGVPAGALVLGSKWGYVYTGDWRLDAERHEVKDHSLANLRRQSQESRDLLGPHLAVYQIHSATLESGVLEDAAVLRALAALRDEGMLVGLTVSGPRQADVILRALEASVDGTSPFGCVQATWNLLEPSSSAALAEAHAAGWGVIVKEALANGRLSRHGSGPAVGRLEAVADRHGTSEDAVAIAAALAQPWAHVVLSGAATVEQLHSNLRALDVALSSQDLEELTEVAEAPDAYWQTRRSLSWA